LATELLLNKRSNETVRGFRFCQDTAMKIKYDIFRKSPAHGLIWVEAVQDLEIARARISALWKACPSDYLVYDLRRARIVLQIAMQS
jgi:hypothetical protein